MTHSIKTPKKLIEVALPLDAINVACAREKSIRHGHPSTLHLWWARRPLAAARAVIFSQMVNDPSWKWEMEHPGEPPPNHLKASWAASRKRLFGILEELVKWESTTKEEVLKKARLEIVKSWRETCELNRDHPEASTLFNPNQLPAFHDPFAGGGAIPLEAQRLGLEAYASDLNPVAVLINKAMIEIPPRFADKPPVNPTYQKLLTAEKVLHQWEGAQGLAEDVRYYGQWMRDEAEKRIGHLYPKIEITAEMAANRPDLAPYIGQKLTVIAWLWARTVKSPNPAFSHTDVPLVSTFMLSTKEGKEAYVEPVIEGDRYRFTVKVGKPKDVEAAKNGTKLTGANFRCILSDTPIAGNYIKAEGKAGQMGAWLMAIVAESPRGRIYLAPTQEHEVIAQSAEPEWKPEIEFFQNALGFRIGNYGMSKWSDLFTPRQLVALTTFSDLVAEAREKIRQDAITAGVPDDDTGIDTGGIGAKAYAEAVSVYLALAIDRMANTICTIARWTPERQQTVTVFARQAIPMTWDFPDVNPFAGAAGDYCVSVDGVIKGIPSVTKPFGFAEQADASAQNISQLKTISTDPPYYDNIGYADLSDFFYVWLRRVLRTTFPALFATLTTPKAEELVATPYRHGNKEKAEAFFLDGMTEAMHRMAQQAHPAFPVTIYYAFKQAETKDISGTSSTGWETFLEAVIKAGFVIGGTWPLRTELGNRMRGMKSNALASSIVLVCRARPVDAPTLSRRVFLRELNTVLPEALDSMIRGAEGDHSPVAPVDLSQAIIGPGMAVFSKYAAVLEADGSQMTVKAALQLVNRFLAEGDFDPDTQFCLQWFEQNGWREGKFGDADTLARAKGTSVEGVRQSGVVQATGGVVRLLKWADYQQNWNPATDTRLPVWEALHQVIRIFNQGGESAAGTVLSAIPGQAEAARQLAYRLYTLCERAGMAEDARAYNEIITSWNAIEAAATREPRGQQGNLFEFL